MRRSAAGIAASLGLAVAVWAQPAAAQGERNFVFTDNEGHLILRFAGSGSGGLDADQMEEVVNVSLSTMVHDRLRADALFEAEAVDSQWADSLAPEIRRHVIETGPEFTAIDVECRSSTCRLVLEHANRGTVTEHQALMGVVQFVLEAFIEAHPESVHPVFLIVAYHQEPEVPHIKVFLTTAASHAQVRQ